MVDCWSCFFFVFFVFFVFVVVVVVVVVVDGWISSFEGKKRTGLVA